MYARQADPRQANPTPVIRQLDAKSAHLSIQLGSQSMQLVESGVQGGSEAGPLLVFCPKLSKLLLNALALLAELSPLVSQLLAFGLDACCQAVQLFALSLWVSLLIT